MGRITLLALLAGFAAQAAITLHNDVWTVEVAPSTLAITVRGVEVSAGSGPHVVDGLRMGPAEAGWRWDDGRFRVSARLEGADLKFSIEAASADKLGVLRQPEAAMGKGLILPLAEGHYVPAGSGVWRDFLVQHLGEIDTSQDLSLPLWGMDYGSYSLHWVLTNPFNNRLAFSSGKAGGVAVALSHEFTRLAPPTPFTFMLHLDGADLLGGAKRYRAWLMAEGRYETLEAKIAAVPEGQKLLGASHIYLWGNGLIAAKDVRSWPEFLARLRSKDGLAVQLVRLFDDESRRVLAEAGAPPDGYRQRVLVNAVNAAFNARAGWQPDDEDAAAMASRFGEIRRAAVAGFGGALSSDAAQWGGTLSAATMDRLAAAGLERLWLGLGDGWEGGLWHPEAIAAAKAHGYLIAPYDSYETALPVAGANPDWTTAHLGERAYQECGIVRADGKVQSGFLGAGYYTNPRCVRGVLEARVGAVAAKAGFNSWFLDAYGSGMLFDDYRAGRETTMARQADENRDIAHWIARTVMVPVGSEDGNATTAGGLFFAHGMQTPVIGWGDAELHNKSSTYYLGNWWPADMPAVFFKAAPMKEPYRTIYFDPAMRLPLYQAVFHGSVITSHHWLFDSLKLTNVRVENELMQLLYNVPPLYNLSEASWKDRLPAILRQDAFFRPLHARVGTLELTGFKWLSADRRVQQTTFADGTRLVADFGEGTIKAFVPGRGAVVYRVVR